MYEKENIDYRGMSIKIYFDESAESPALWDNKDAFLCSDYRILYVDSKSISAKECRRAIEAGRYFLNGFYIFPVCIYNHDGIAVSLGVHRGWDNSNGWAFVCVRRSKGWSWSKSKAEKIAVGVLDEWNMYLSGDVYGFVAEDEEGEMIESCWGFYGASGIEEAISEAKTAIDYELENRLKRHLAKRKAEIRSHVPLYARTAYAF